MRYASEFVRDGRVIFLACVLVIGVCGMGFTPMHLVSWIAALVGFLVFWPIEYGTHRYLLHEFPQLMPHAYEGHVIHHIKPKETRYLLTPNRYNVPAYMVIAVVGSLITRNINMTASFMAGMSLAQLFYEWKHFVSHRPIIPWTPWGKAMKKRHLLHHHLDAQYWYGVSNPVFDYVMGTDIDADHAREVRHAHGPAMHDAEISATKEH